MDIDKHIAAVKELFTLHKKSARETMKEPLHSLPITPDERAKREHEAAEHQRFEDAFGNYVIARETGTNYITQIRKQVEDVVIERNYTREDGYVVAVETRLKIERTA